MKKLSFAILIALMILTMTACSKNAEQSQQQPQQTESKEAQLPTKDMAGNDITVPTEINKIISLAPSITEILIDLGYGDKIIAADTYSEGIEGLPEGIQYIDMMAPDAEKIAALEPDVLLATGMMQKDGVDPLKTLKDMGICIAYIPSSDSIEKIYDDIIFISEVVQAKDKGQAIVDEAKAKVAEIKAIGDTIIDRKTVYFEIAAAPSMYSFGSGVFLNEMIQIIGAENILADQQGWISVAEEVVVSKNPDVIITNVDYIENPVDEIKARSGWNYISAISNNEVYSIDNSITSVPNHNFVKGLEQMAKAVYPDKY